MEEIKKEIAELKVLVSKLLEIETKKFETMYPNVKIMLGGKQIN